MTTLEEAPRPAPGPSVAAPRSSTAARWFDRSILAIVVAGPLVGVVVALAMAVRRGSVGGLNLCLFGVFWALTLFGIEAGFHRYFSHRAFRTGRAVEALFVILGSMAFQGPAVWWAAVHRRHHQNADAEGDPHSPHLRGVGLRGMLAGLWDAHVGWNRREFETIRDKSTWKELVPDLLQNRWLRAVNRGYFLWLLLGLLLPAALGGALSRSWRGFAEGFLWGGAVRMFAVTQGIYLVNSVGHAFGSRPFALHARDRATNNGLLALLTLGAGYHHNHHVFPASATTQVEPWQVDISGWVLRGLAALGVVWDLRLPPPEARSWGRRRKVNVRVDADGTELRARLSGLTARGAFLESRAAGTILREGTRVRLKDFAMRGGSGPAPRIPDGDAVILRACWQGVDVRFTDPTTEFAEAIALLCRKG